MSKVQDGAWAPRKKPIRSENRNFKQNPEWKTSDLIKKANSYIKLISVLKEYNIKIQPNGRDDWSKPMNCPFPDHKDSSPSFGYNYKTDSYHCFVCGHGRAVEFMAKKSREPIRKVAVFLLNNINIDPYKEETVETEDSSVINSKIIEFLQFVSSKFQANKKNPEKILYFEKLMWRFDTFIVKSFDKSGFSSKVLDSEIERIKELIIDIEENID